VPKSESSGGLPGADVRCRCSAGWVKGVMGFFVAGRRNKIVKGELFAGRSPCETWGSNKFKV
jgi:hypothetical protein